jgi:hypothetical protein
MLGSLSLLIGVQKKLERQQRSGTTGQGSAGTTTAKPEA